MSTLTKIIAVVVLAVVGQGLRNLIFYTDLLKDPSSYAATPNSHTCAVQGGFPTDGFEDMAYLDKSVAVACAGDLAHLMHDPEYLLPNRSRGSTCAIIAKSDTDAGMVFLRPLTLVSASGEAFRPEGERLLHIHGIDAVNILGKTTPFVVAVNHGYGTDGETLEVFHIDFATMSLVHRRTVRLPETQRFRLLGALNDVAVEQLTVADDGSISGAVLVSRWMEFGDFPEGRAAAGWEGSVFGMLIKAMFYLRGIFGVFNSEVLYCTFTSVASEPMQCRTHVSGMFMANGVVVVGTPPLKNTAPASSAWVRTSSIGFSIDLLRHRLVVRTPSAPTARFDDTISVPVIHTFDNFVADRTMPIRCAGDFADETRQTCVVTFLAGAIPSVFVASKIDDITQKFGDVISPGGITRVVVEVVLSNGAVTAATVLNESVVLMHDGMFHGTSVGVILEGDNGDKYAVMGSYKLQGILGCGLPRNGGAANAAPPAEAADSNSSAATDTKKTDAKPSA